MSKNRFSKLWKLMSDNNFVSSKPTSDALFCGLCKKLLIEPYATECGCLFCKKCINTYLNNEIKRCPGTKNMCAEELLKFEINVNKDNITSNKISKTIVKCPNEKCTYECELNNIEDHFTFCKMRPLPCPFQVLGCGDGVLTGDNINSHLISENLSHSQLLLEAINNLKNDIDGLNDIKTLIEDLKKSGEERDMSIIETENLKVEVRQLKDQNVILKNNQDNQTREINKYKECREINKNDNEVLKGEINELRKEIKSLRVGVCDGKAIYDDMEMRLRNEFDQLKRELEILKKNSLAQKEIEELKKSFTVQNQLFESVKIKVAKCSEELDKVSKNKQQSSLSGLYDCVWMIENLSKKKGEHFSEVFSTNNYRFCVRVWIGTDNLWLFLCVRMGERDEVAQWPMRHSVTLAVMNQGSGRPFMSERYSVDSYEDDKSVFGRPTNDTDGRIGNMQVSLADLRKVGGVLARDSLMVTCVLDPPAR